MDCTLGTTTGGDPRNPDKTFLFGQEYMARRVYQLSPPEVCLRARGGRLFVFLNFPSDLYVRYGAI
jgi:hypothetical protein